MDSKFHSKLLVMDTDDLKQKTSLCSVQGKPAWQDSKLIFWITNPFRLVGVNFTNQFYKGYYPRICSRNSNILTIKSSGNKWGKLMYGLYNVWMEWFKLHDDLQNEIYRRFNAHLHFPFNYIAQKGEIHHKRYKTLFV